MEHRKARMKDFLAESLAALMQEKPFEKITIKQICDRTGVIRATFYNHFEDKYDALNYICVMMLCDEHEKLLTAGDMEGYVRSLCTLIHAHAAFFRKAFQVQGQNDFDTMFLNAAGRGILMVLEQHDIACDPYRSDELALYFANAFMYLCKNWLRKGCVMSAPEFCAYSLGLLMNGLKEYIGNKGKI